MRVATQATATGSASLVASVPAGKAKDTAAPAGLAYPKVNFVTGLTRSVTRQAGDLIHYYKVHFVTARVVVFTSTS